MLARMDHWLREASVKMGFLEYFPKIKQRQIKEFTVSVIWVICNICDYDIVCSENKADRHEWCNKICFA